MSPPDCHVEMDETAEKQNKCAQTWLPVESPPSIDGNQIDQDQDSQGHHVRMQSSPQSNFFEELFCASQTSNTLVPLARAFMTSCGPQSDVVKEGYLGKQGQNHRRYFVLRTGSHTGLSRLEWYKSQEKFKVEKSTGKAALFGSSKQRAIYLRCCLGVSRISSTRKGHMVAVYAKGRTMMLVVEDQREQEEWYLAIKKLMEEERKDEAHGECYNEDDDGYCTLPPAAFFKEVWPVTVKPKGLGSSRSLAGESRLCLTASSLILVRVRACSDLPSVTIPLLSVRRFGHLDESFYLDLGRSAPNGPGEIWMEAGDEAVAQHIHEAVRETVKALRALPDFNRSPTSCNHHHTLLYSKRSRPKYRDQLVNARPLGSSLSLPARSTEIQASPTRSYLGHQNSEPESTSSFNSSLSSVRCHQISMSEANSYMDMKMDQTLVNERRETDCSVANCGLEAWAPIEEDEEDEEGLDYMVMSRQGGRSSSGTPQDEYVTMLSPRKHECPVDSPLQISLNSSASDSCSSLHPSYHQPQWLLTPFRQSETQMNISSSSRTKDDAGQEKITMQRRLPAQTRTTWSPVRSNDGSVMMTPFVTSGPDNNKPIQTSPNSGTHQFSQLQALPDRSVRRYWLSLCLPSCLQAEDRS